MVLADLGRKLTTALRSLGNSPVINEEVLERKIDFTDFFEKMRKMILKEKNEKSSEKVASKKYAGR